MVQTGSSKKCIWSNLKEEGALAGPNCDGLMTWRKISEWWELVAGEVRLGEETNGNLSWGRSRFFKDRSAIGYRYSKLHPLEASVHLSVATTSCYRVLSRPVHFYCDMISMTTHVSVSQGMCSRCASLCGNLQSMRVWSRPTGARDVTAVEVVLQRHLVDWLWWDETMSQNCGHQRAYCSSPGWYVNMGAMVVMMSAGDNYLFVHQISLAVLPAETSGASRRNWRMSENLHISIWNTSRDI
jgi:hypothetical protein